MFDYETGLLFAFLLWLYNVITSIIMINSRFERNMNKIGQRLSWLSMTMKPMDTDDEKRSALMSFLKFSFLQLIGLLFALTSWLSVAMTLGQIIYRKSKDSGVPQNIKEFRWKMKNMDMTFDQVVRESFKLNEDPNTSYEDFKQAAINEMTERGLKIRY